MAPYIHQVYIQCFATQTLHRLTVGQSSEIMDYCGLIPLGQRLLSKYWHLAGALQRHKAETSGYPGTRWENTTTVNRGGTCF